MVVTTTVHIINPGLLLAVRHWPFCKKSRPVSFKLTRNPYLKCMWENVSFFHKSPCSSVYSTRRLLKIYHARSLHPSPRMSGRTPTAGAGAAVFLPESVAEFQAGNSGLHLFNSSLSLEPRPPWQPSSHLKSRRRMGTASWPLQHPLPSAPLLLPLN